MPWRRAQQLALKLGLPSGTALCACSNNRPSSIPSYATGTIPVCRDT